MEINSQTGSYHQVQNLSGDVVFARNSQGVAWPAKILRINKDKTYRVLFYILKKQGTFTIHQVWPFNSLTIQRFVSSESPSSLIDAIEAAQQYLEKQGKNIEEERFQLRILRSFQQSVGEYSEEMELSQPRLPLKSKGLFIIHEVNQILEESKMHPNLHCIRQEQPRALEPVKQRRGRKNKTADRQMCEKRDEIVLATKTRMIKSSWKELPWNTKRKRRARKNKSKSARKNAKEGAIVAQNEHLNFSLKRKITKRPNKQLEDQQKEKLSEQVKENKAVCLLPANQNIMHIPRVQQLAEQIIQQAHPTRSPTAQQLSSLVQEQLLGQTIPQTLHIQNEAATILFGPLNFSEVSTQATFYSGHSSQSIMNQSTTVVMNQSNSKSLTGSQKEGNNPAFQFESSIATSIPRDRQDSLSEEEKTKNANHEKEIKQGNQQIMIILDQLIRILEGKRRKLTVKQQLSLCQALDTFDHRNADKSILEEVIRFLKLFEGCTSSLRDKCYMQFLLLKEKIDCLILISKMKAPKNQEVKQILDTYSQNWMSD